MSRFELLPLEEKRFRKKLCLACGKRFQKMTKEHDCCSKKCFDVMVERFQNRPERGRVERP